MLFFACPLITISSVGTWLPLLKLKSSTTIFSPYFFDKYSPISFFFVSLVPVFPVILNNSSESLAICSDDKYCPECSILIIPPFLHLAKEFVVKHSFSPLKVFVE